MKASTKERGMLLAIAIVFLAVIIFGGYFLFGPKKAGSMITGPIRVIDKNNEEAISTMIRRKDRYVFKLEENGKQYIETHVPDNLGQGIYDVSKYGIDKSEFDKLEFAKDYFFNVRFYEADNFSTGIVKMVYTEDPARR
ncbi:hypothetical protein [Clostridium sp.]|uniref:hypothetical protein n=1 Tax=Clostridium sp. TaxID=1506 RepID=UPI002FCC3501